MALHPETLALHADNELDLSNDVAPPLHPSSTFRFPSDPDQLIPLRLRSVGDSRGSETCLIADMTECRPKTKAMFTLA